MLDQTAPCALVHGVDIAATQFRFGPQQDEVIALVNTWLQGHSTRTEKRLVFRLFGFAGTGKTTIARHLAASVDGEVCYAASTGKAALMMQRNGCAGATTIHAWLYTTEIQPDGSMRFILNRSSKLRKAKLIVIDECSMVDEQVGRDLESFGVPILVLGDPAQLPPVRGKGYFTHGCKPDAMLTEIHRQARDNPIIRIASDVREGRPIVYGDYGSLIIDRPGSRDVDDMLRYDQIIVGKNTTRSAFNTRIRKHLGRDSPLPMEGDRLVCLRNDMNAGVLNGALFTVTGLAHAKKNNQVALHLRDDDSGGDSAAGGGQITVNIRREFFEGGVGDLEWRDLDRTQQFDYGYALTGHKSQGSQWSSVIAYDQGKSFGSDSRAWLYTVITRASDNLTLIR